MRGFLIGIVAAFTLAACGQPSPTPEAPPAAPAAPTVNATFPPAEHLVALNGARFTVDGSSVRLVTPSGAGAWSSVLVAGQGAKTDPSTHYRITLSISEGALILNSSTDSAAPDHAVESVNVGPGEQTVTVLIDKNGPGVPVLYFVNGNGRGATTAVISNAELITQP